MLDSVQAISDVMSQPGSVEAVIEGPFNLFKFVNFSQIGVAMSQIGDIIKNFTSSAR